MNNESAYEEEVQYLTEWCSGNNIKNKPDLNTSKTKELMVDFRKSNHIEPFAQYLLEEEVESVESFKLIGVHISALSHLDHTHLPAGGEGLHRFI